MLTVFNTPVQSKCKGKGRPRTGGKAQRGSRGVVLLFLYPRHWMCVGGQHHAPTVLPPGKTRYSLYRRLGWPQGRSGRVRKISATPGYDPRSVQPVARRYTDRAIPAKFNIPVPYFSSSENNSNELQQLRFILRKCFYSTCFG